MDAPRLIGKRIKQRREELEWSQQKLAQESGISVRTIPRLEAGNFTRLRKHTAQVLSDALAIPVDELRPPQEYDDEDDLRADLRQVNAKLDLLLKRLGADLPPAPPSEVRQPHAAPKPKPRTSRDAAKDRGKGSQRRTG